MPRMVTSSYAAAVAAEVRAEAARRRQTVSEIAQLIHMSRSTVSDRWHGKRPWQLDELWTLAQAWDLPLSHLTQPRAAA